MRDPRIDEIQDHLYNGLVIMDLVGHIEALPTLWRRDSVAYAMRLAFREWKAADDLLSELAEDLHEPCCDGAHVPCPTTPGEEGAGTPPPADERVAGPPSKGVHSWCTWTRRGWQCRCRDAVWTQSSCL